MRDKARALGWIVTPFFLLAFACGSSGEKRSLKIENQPSVILISIDTLRADRLGCYGYKRRATSPNIDALAADGIVFENFISASSWTTPAHLSMLTSLYPTTHGLTASFKEVKRDIQRKGEHHFFKLPERRVTLAEALKASGFATAAFTGGVTMAPVLGFEQGFDLYDSSMYKVDESNHGRMEDWISARRGRKFFLFWHTFEVHAPYLDTRFLADVVPGRRGERVALELLAATGKPRGGFDRLGKRANSQRHRQMQVLKDNDLFQPTVCEALYTGGIRSMDTWIAKLVAFLREADLYDDVMIVITSDHGEEFADHSPRAFYDRHGHSLYEELIHVPLIIKLPGQQHAGLRVREVTRMVDVMPTILDVMEAASPKAEEMQGASLRGYWDPDLPQPQTSPAFSEALARRYEKKALRDLRYKYILSMSEEQVRTHGRSKLPETPEQVELYKLRSDPQERRNLIDPDREGGVSETAAAFDFLLREFASGEQGEVEPTNIDEDTLEMLRSLGYME